MGDDLGVLKAIDRHLAGLRAAVASLVPDQLTGPDAARLVERAVDIERLGLAVTCTRCARRVAETKAYDGHTSAASWLAGASGESTGAAQGVLDVAEQLAERAVRRPTRSVTAGCRLPRPRSSLVPARSTRRRRNS